jgi:hypothetical protein
MLVMQQVPLVWKRDEVALRHFVGAAPWICRTGAPWRDLPDGPGFRLSLCSPPAALCLRDWWDQEHPCCGRG